MGECSDCKHFDAKNFKEHPWGYWDKLTAPCRRFPPGPKGFPYVLFTDHCGEYASKDDGGSQ